MIVGLIYGVIKCGPLVLARVNLVRPGQMETEDTQGHRDPLVSRVYPEQLERREPR